MRNRLAAIAATLLLTLGALTVATPAAASPSIPPSSAEQVSLLAPPASCGSQNLCVYVDSGYQTGEGYILIPVGAAGQCVGLSPYRNAISSAFNFSGRNVRFFKNTGCTGTDYKTLNNGTGNPQFATHWGVTWNDSTDAVRFM